MSTGHMDTEQPDEFAPLRALGIVICHHVPLMGHYRWTNGAFEVNTTLWETVPLDMRQFIIEHEAALAVETAKGSSRV